MYFCFYSSAKKKYCMKIFRENGGHIKTNYIKVALKVV